MKSNSVSSRRSSNRFVNSRSLRVALSVCILAALDAGTSLAAGPVAGETVKSKLSVPDLSGVWQVASYQSALRTEQGQVPPFTAEAAAIYEKHVAARKAGDTSFDTAAKCVSPGFPRVLYLPYPFEIIQRPHQLTFLFEWNHLFRTVKLTPQSPEYDYAIAMGASTGQWTADVLTVNTTGLLDSTLLDAAGIPHSEDLQLTERYRLLDGGKSLEVGLTINDPKTFTSPWDTVVRFRKRSGYEISEDVCLDRIAQGEPAIKAP